MRFYNDYISQCFKFCLYVDSNYICIGPTGFPGNVTTNVTTTAVVLKWTEVDCSERNGIVIHYQVAYRRRTGSSRAEGDMLLNATGLQAVIQELRPSTEYEVSIAAVNGAGVGPAYIINVTTVPKGAANSPIVRVYHCLGGGRVDVRNGGEGL